MSIDYTRGDQNEANVGIGIIRGGPLGCNNCHYIEAEQTIDDIFGIESEAPNGQ